MRDNHDEFCEEGRRKLLQSCSLVVVKLKAVKKQLLSISYLFNNLTIVLQFWLLL